MIPTSYAHSWWFRWVPDPPDQWIDPSQFGALSWWSLSCDHFCFSFCLTFFPIVFQISGHKRAGLDVSFSPKIWQVSRPIDILIIVDAFFLFDIQNCLRNSGNVNVLQWNGEWFLSRRVKFDSGLNVMAVFDASWHGPKIIYRFTGIRKRILKLWKRPFWFSQKINITLSLNWSMPYQGGCSQVLISSKGFDSSICDWKINSPSLVGVASFALSLFEKIFDTYIVSNSSRSATSTSPFQILTRVQNVSEEQSR